MPVDTRHPDYDAMAGKWERVRDAVQGEDAVKEKTSEYLPVPPGIKEGERSREYLNYLRRATYPDVVGPAIEGMVGLMARKESAIELPDSLAYLDAVATPDGLGLRDLERRLRHEVLTTGRYALFVDVPAEGGDPYIATYPAEAIINWRQDGRRLTMVVFEETLREPKVDDPFADETVTQWREASMDAERDGDGNILAERYVVRVWRKATDGDGNQTHVVVSEVTPSRQGEPLEEVPAIMIGSRDLLPEPDAIPLLGVVNKTLDFYRQVADYRLGLFMSSQATPYATGVQPNEAPSAIGPSAFWLFSSENAEVGFLEVSGNGLEAQRQALNDTKAEIQDAAMKVMGDGRRGAEAAEALRIRFQSQTATLATVAQTTAAGLQEALRFVADWAGAESAQVTVTPNLDFIREVPDAQVLSAIGQLVERGVMPEDVLSEYARRTDLTDMDDDTFRQLSPAAQAVPSGDVEG